MDWESHVTAFHAEWILKYAAHPSKASWKSLLDDLMLVDKQGYDKFPEKRAILMYPMSRKDKMRLLRGLPKRATYIRQCLYAHWRIELKQDLSQTDHIGTESLWHNARFKIHTDKATERYFSSTIETLSISDVLDGQTNQPFTNAEWRSFIDDLHQENAETVPTPQFLRTQIQKIQSIVQQVPPAILQSARHIPPHVPTQDEAVALVATDGSRSLRYAIFDPGGAPPGGGAYEELWIDAMGFPHETGTRISQRPHEDIQAIVWWKHSKWDWRVCGPEGQVFPRPDGWKLGTNKIRLDQISVREYTKELTMRKFVVPACEASWNAHLNATLPWKKIWRITSTFATPRDQLTGLKLVHRNLYVAQREPHDKSCRACPEEESMLHLCECGVIREEFWSELIELAKATGMPAPIDDVIFIATGALANDKVVSRYHSIIWFLGWRCLYAEVVNSRVESRTISLDNALKRVVSMLIGRLRAYGKKWADWVQASRLRTKPNTISRKHRNKKLIYQQADGSYEIHDAILEKAKALGLMT